MTDRNRWWRWKPRHTILMCLFFLIVGLYVGFILGVVIERA